MMINPYEYMQEREEILKDFDAFCDAIEGKAAKTFSGQQTDETAERLAKYSCEDPRVGNEDQGIGGDGTTIDATAVNVQETEL